MTTLIPLLDTSSQKRPQILQLYQNLELFSEGEPVQNSLFVLGSGVDGTGRPHTHLLIVDPPADDRPAVFRAPDHVEVAPVYDVVVGPDLVVRLHDSTIRQGAV